MKNRLLQLALMGMLALLAPTPSASAQTLEGSFDLPVAAQWGLAKLPAGHYIFILYNAESPYLIRIKGKKANAMIMASGGVDLAKGGAQKIDLVKTAKGWNVTSFRIPQLGMVLSYQIPKRSKALMAKNAANQRAPFPSQGK
jgi:hypothetical protein